MLRSQCSYTCTLDVYSGAACDGQLVFQQLGAGRRTTYIGLADRWNRLHFSCFADAQSVES